MAEAVQSWWSAIAARDLIWLSVGLFGQTLFSARWIVQWVASEQLRRSMVPDVFWYLSLLGGLLVLSYGIHKADPVIILGQFGVIVYARNLMLIRKAAGPQRDGGAGSRPALPQ